MDQPKDSEATGGDDSAGGAVSGGQGDQVTDEAKPMSKKLTALAVGALLIALSGVVDAQQTGKVFRIGYLDNTTASGMAVLIDTFRQELRRLGWIEGKNITIEYRFA